MKKLILLLCVLCPVCVWADNIKMVTYFPVPYMTYQNLNVTQADNKGGVCTVGLSGQCEIKTAGSFAISENLDATGKTLKLGFGSNTNPNISATNLEVGANFTTAGTSKMSFAKELDLLYFGDSNQKPPVTLKAGQVGGVSNRKISEFHIETLSDGGTAKLPLGSGTGNCTEDISWKKLTIDGNTGLYLTCGAGKTPTCVAYKGESTTLTNIDGTFPSQIRSTMDSCHGNPSNQLGFTNGQTGLDASWCNRGSCTDYYGLDTSSSWDTEYTASCDKKETYSLHSRCVSGWNVPNSDFPWYEHDYTCRKSERFVKTRANAAGHYTPAGEQCQNLDDFSGGYVEDACYRACGNKICDKVCTYYWKKAQQCGDPQYTNSNYAWIELHCRPYKAIHRQTWTFKWEYR